MRISAQVLDSTYGRVAVGVRAHLEHADHIGWAPVADAETDSDGRIESWGGWLLERGLYRMVFDSGSYFAPLGVSTAYPEVAVIFRMWNESDGCQVQVALSPYSYSAYVGSIKN